MCRTTFASVGTNMEGCSLFLLGFRTDNLSYPLSVISGLWLGPLIFTYLQYAKSIEDGTAFRGKARGQHMPLSHLHDELLEIIPSRIWLEWQRMSWISMNACGWSVKRLK